MRHMRAAMLALALTVLGTGALAAMMGRKIPSPDPVIDTPSRNPPPARALWPPQPKLHHMQQVGTFHHTITTSPPRPPRSRLAAACTRRHPIPICPAASASPAREMITHLQHDHMQQGVLASFPFPTILPA